MVVLKFMTLELVIFREQTQSLTSWVTNKLFIIFFIFIFNLTFIEPNYMSLNYYLLINLRLVGKKISYQNYKFSPRSIIILQLSLLLKIFQFSDGTCQEFYKNILLYSICYAICNINIYELEFVKLNKKWFVVNLAYILT